MINLTINGVSYKLPIEKLQTLLDWLQSNGATKILEGNTPSHPGTTLINE